MNAWVKELNGKVSLLHFNHKIRKESNYEEKFVKDVAKKYDMGFKILRWDGTKPISSIMRVARDQRYQKICEFCREKNILTLMTAHHLDDLLETYVMRKKRKYVTLGLSSIPKINIQNDLQILRPLLGIRKERLIQTCFKNNLQCLVDPTNKDNKFERTKIRNYLKKLSQKKYMKVYEDFRRSKKKNLMIEEKISNFFLDYLFSSRFGSFQIPKDKFLEESINLKIEILKKILVTCSGKIYPPKTKSIKYLLVKISKFSNSKYSLHSCIILIKSNEIRFYKEYELIKKLTPDCTIIKKRNNILWDGRFNITSSDYDILCYKMNEKLWLKIKDKYANVKKKKKINFEVLKTLPVIKTSRDLIIPFLSDENELETSSVLVTFQPKIPLTKKNF